MLAIVIISALSAGIVFAAGCKTGNILNRRKDARLKGAEHIAFCRQCDACRVAVGELADGKGEWLDEKLKLGGLFYTSTHSLPVGMLVAAKLKSGECRYCGLRPYVLFEITEKDDGKSNFPRILCSVCPSLECGLIERNGGYTHSKRYASLFDSSASIKEVLSALLERRQFPDGPPDPRYPTGRGPDDSAKTKQKEL